MVKKSALKTGKKKRPSPTEVRKSEPFGNVATGKILIDGKERLFLLKSELEDVLGNWPKEVDRMLHASRHGSPWLTIVSNQSGKSGAEVRVTTESALRAAQRLAEGERPPLMPSERKKSNPMPQGVAPGGIPDAVIASLLRAGELLPPGVASVEFRQNNKTIFVSWENGVTQIIRKKVSRGRSTRVMTVCFATSENAISPLLRKSLRSERPDSDES